MYSSSASNSDFNNSLLNISDTSNSISDLTEAQLSAKIFMRANTVVDFSQNPRQEFSPKLDLLFPVVTRWSGTFHLYDAEADADMESLSATPRIARSHSHPPEYQHYLRFPTNLEASPFVFEMQPDASDFLDDVRKLYDGAEIQPTMRGNPLLPNQDEESELKQENLVMQMISEEPAYDEQAVNLLTDPTLNDEQAVKLLNHPEFKQWHTINYFLLTSTGTGTKIGTKIFKRVVNNVKIINPVKKAATMLINVPIISVLPGLVFGPFHLLKGIKTGFTGIDRFPVHKDSRLEKVLEHVRHQYYIKSTLDLAKFSTYASLGLVPVNAIMSSTRAAFTYRELAIDWQNAQSRINRYPILSTNPENIRLLNATFSAQLDNLESKLKTAEKEKVVYTMSAVAGVTGFYPLLFPAIKYAGEEAKEAIHKHAENKELGEKLIKSFQEWQTLTQEFNELPTSEEKNMLETEVDTKLGEVYECYQEWLNANPKRIAEALVEKLCEEHGERDAILFKTDLRNHCKVVHDFDAACELIKEYYSYGEMEAARGIVLWLMNLN